MSGALEYTLYSWHSFYQLDQDIMDIRDNIIQALINENDFQCDGICINISFKTKGCKSLSRFRYIDQPLITILFYDITIVKTLISLPVHISFIVQYKKLFIQLILIVTLYIANMLLKIGTSGYTKNPVFKQIPSILRMFRSTMKATLIRFSYNPRFLRKYVLKQKTSNGSASFKISKLKTLSFASFVCEINTFSK